jgi:hypothetical protein
MRKKQRREHQGVCCACAKRIRAKEAKLVQKHAERKRVVGTHEQTIKCRGLNVEKCTSKRKRKSKEDRREMKQGTVV